MRSRAVPARAAAAKTAPATSRARRGEPWGLVSVGGAAGSYLARMNSFLAHLGPVKSSSFQVASRLSNALRHGYPVSYYANLELCPLIFIFEPEHSLDRVLRDVAAQMPVHRTMVVLCECTRDSLASNPLRAAGARIASLNQVEQSRDKLFVAEGDPHTLKALERLMDREKRKLVAMPPGAKPMFLAGVQLAKYLPLPMIAASVESLRAAGLPRAEAARLTAATPSARRAPGGGRGRSRGHSRALGRARWPRAEGPRP